MRTDWVQVVAALVVGVGVGTLLIINAETIASLQRALASSMRYPDRVVRRMSPLVVRLVGGAFVLIGLVGAVLGLFFADKM